MGYTLLEQLEGNEKEFWEKQTSEDRMNMDIRTRGEAKILIKDNLQSLPPSFQVSMLSVKKMLTDSCKGCVL